MRPFVSLSCSREDDRLVGKRLVRVLKAPEENATNILPELSLGSCGSRGHPSRTHRHSRLPRARRPRPRICLRKGCGRKYQPRRRNQRYCQDAECLREVRRWQAARRQAKRRRDARVKNSMPRPKRNAGGELKSHPRPWKIPSCARAWSRSRKFFPLPLCDRPGCHEPPVISPRNPARYCGTACRQAVRNVQDRERKWRSRGTLGGRKKRAYRIPCCTPGPTPASAQRRRRCAAPGTAGMTTPPRFAGRQLSRGSGRFFLAWAFCCSPSGAQA